MQVSKKFIVSVHIALRYIFRYHDRCIFRIVGGMNPENPEGLYNLGLPGRAEVDVSAVNPFLKKFKIGGGREAHPVKVQAQD